MRAYRHLEEGARCVAYTRDPGGVRLPVRGSVWLFAGSVDLDRRGGLDPDLPTQALKAALLRQGYFLWPEEDAAPAEPRAFTG